MYLIENDTITFDYLLYKIFYSIDLSMYEDYVSDTLKEDIGNNMKEYDVVITYEEILKISKDF